MNTVGRDMKSQTCWLGLPCMTLITLAISGVSDKWRNCSGRWICSEVERLSDERADVLHLNPAAKSMKKRKKKLTAAKQASESNLKDFLQLLLWCWRIKMSPSWAKLWLWVLQDWVWISGKPKRRPRLEFGISCFCWSDQRRYKAVLNRTPLQSKPHCDSPWVSCVVLLWCNSSSVICVVFTV